MLEFFFLILTPLAIMDTVLLFVIANKVTDGRCWEATKKVMKWGLVILCSVIVLGLVLGLVVNNWEKFQKPLTELGEALLGLLGFWALFQIIRYGIVCPFLKGLRGH
jgi:hypothetical protein